ncbi:Protein with possible 2 TPR domains, related [Eimeria praecox]|uniref:Protein with possible 2 TPR domains, related n=1 Tax=Eimeria praecox TaxID=51316 RepID=U6G5U8_9EIME|nr:Protein with possible 2 TPR domains, related [Eimeria praecox]
MSDQPTTPEAAETNTRKEQKEEEPPLSLEKTQEVLLDFLDAYTSEPAASKLKELRSLADFDYRRLVLRCRKYLPEVQQPILQRHGVGTPSSSSNSSSNSNSSSSNSSSRDSDNHRCNMRLLEKSVSYWRFRDEMVEELTRDCLKAVFGDVADIDV